MPIVNVMIPEAEIEFYSWDDTRSQWSRAGRSLRISTESVTLGSHPRSDIHLHNLSEDILIELKSHDGAWYLLNPMKSARIKVNGIPCGLETRLHHEDELRIENQQLLFKLLHLPKLNAPEFVTQPESDAELWNFLTEEADFDEILINGHDSIFVDFKGNLFKSPYQFSSNDFLTHQIVQNTQTTEGWASWRLDRKLRFQAALPPVSQVPHIAIRKFRRKNWRLENYLEQATASPEQIEFLREAVLSRQNIIISGGTSTGKTLFLRSLLQEIRPHERILVIEEEAEIDWPHSHLIALEAGRGGLRSAVIESLRMRPDRIVVGEVRGPEALEMLQAMNTGHSGSMTSLHANSSREALGRLESLCMMANGSLSVMAVRRMIAQSVQILVHLERLESGVRKISQINRVHGIQGDVISLSDPLEVGAQGLKQKIQNRAE
jgi:pilus assembly protein CpaF